LTECIQWRIVLYMMTNTNTINAEQEAILCQLEEEGKIIRVLQPDFIATQWMPSTHGTLEKYCVCYTLENGRWEGFVSVR
jgi:hypothetical protein